MIILTDIHKKSLLNVARKAIHDSLIGTFRLQRTSEMSLLIKRGVFVTLLKNNELRGCMGHLLSNEALYDEVQHVAQKAAFNDTRFKPVSLGELDEISIEVSILTPFKPVRNLQDIKLGTHGLLLKNQSHVGVFLPKVPIEQNWDIARTIIELCAKAKCASKILDDPKTELLSFETETIS